MVNQSSSWRRWKVKIFIFWETFLSGNCRHCSARTARLRDTKWRPNECRFRANSSTLKLLNLNSANQTFIHSLLCNVTPFISSFHVLFFRSFLFYLLFSVYCFAIRHYSYLTLFCCLTWALLVCCFHWLSKYFEKRLLKCFTNPSLLFSKNSVTKRELPLCFSHCIRYIHLMKMFLLEPVWKRLKH